jgi:hypothetical protein
MMVIQKLFPKTKAPRELSVSAGLPFSLSLGRLDAGGNPPALYTLFPRLALVPFGYLRLCRSPLFIYGHGRRS